MRRSRREGGLRTAAVVALAVLFVMAFAGSALAAAFPDVPADSPFGEAIDALSSRGIIGGYANGDFGIYDSVTRAQYSKIIVGAVGAHTPSAAYPTAADDPTYPDVTADSTLFDFVEEAAWQQLTKGYADGTFGPAKAITRAQLALLIARAGGDALDPAGTTPFTDIADQSAEAQAAIAVCFANGIISGKTATTFDPAGTATRGQAAKMTWNLMQKLAPAQPVVPADPPVKDHSFLTEYNGPQTCEGCHPGAMEGVATSLHFTMDEEEVPGFQGMAGRY